MDIGAARAGATIVLANDTVSEAGQTYRNEFPEVPFVEGDVRDVTEFPSADLVIGGYPCQPFSLGGHRNPDGDSRAVLYREFARCLDLVNPRFFVAENVSGMKGLSGGRLLQEQIALFSQSGDLGYEVNWRLLRAEQYGIPQRRRRLFIVGVRKDLDAHYWFPPPTHGSEREVKRLGLLPVASHGDTIEALPEWPTGEFYERPHDPEGHMSWWYMSRNRKAEWAGPSYTILANLRHTTLHPACQTMEMVWSNLADGFKQKWAFSGEYEHTQGNPERMVLAEPRRLSWREAALIQSFPADFEPSGGLMSKFEQIGNAVPPALMEAVVAPLASGAGLHAFPEDTTLEPGQTDGQQLSMRM